LYTENEATTLLFMGRIPIVLIGCLLGLLIWLWTRDLVGHSAAHIALFLFAFTPDFLAHSQLITTDLPVATFVFASAYLLWRSCRRWTIINVGLGGLAFGAAIASKFSALIILPILVFYWVVRLFSNRPWPCRMGFGQSERTLVTLHQRLRPLAISGAVHIVIPLLTIWTLYGFHYDQPFSDSGDSFYAWERFESQGVVAGSIKLARKIHLVPEPFAYGLLVVAGTTQRSSFLNGEYSTTGWWYYFLETFCIKTPIPLFLAILTALLFLPLRFRKRSWSHLALFAPAALYFVLASASDMNIGHRHLLPMYPFLFVLGAEAVARLYSRPLLKVAVFLLLGWQAIGTINQHPNYLGYFNEFIGGSSNEWKYVVDSNLDWGQDLPGLKRWMDNHGVKKIKLSYLGTGVPEYYGIDYDPLPSFFPLPRTDFVPVKSGDIVAVSATNLQAVHFRHYQKFVDFMTHLRSLEPIAVIGNSIFVFKLPPSGS
ncbi:MAG: glycosyltransferase family 39 protein, partial [Gammaproteobacteria bacterium]